MVARAQEGDHAAFDRIMQLYQDTVARQMRRYCATQATLEELTQDVFVNAYLSLHNYRPRAPFLHWLRTIASRTGFAHWKSERKRQKHLPLADWDISATAETQDKAEESAEKIGIEQIKRTMRELGPDDEQLLYLHYIDGHSLPEIRRITGWNGGMLKMRLYRARRKLRKLLEQ